MSKKQALIITVLSLAALVLALLISRRLWFRLDLTENKAYTISEVSRNLYTEIPDEVHITYYVSDKLAAIHPLPGEIEDLLREYTAHSHGRIRLTVRDPAKAGLTQTVEQLGIQGQQIETVEQNEATIATVYTGILIEYLDKADVLPVVFSLDTLEYDLTSRIRSLVRGTEREVGVIVGDAAKQWSSDYSILDQALGQSGYWVRQLRAGDEIPDTLPVLFVLGGAGDMDEWALYRIDRYIQGGGKVLFAVEGVAVDTQYGIEARLIMDEGLLSMVSYYGATIKPNLVLDEAALSLQYQSQNQSGALMYRVVRYPHWVGVLEQNGNSEHPVTAGFGGVDLYWPNHIELNPPEPVEATPLFFSTPGAWLMTSDFNVNPEATFLYELEAAETTGTKTLGVALTGTFPSWFAGVPKPVREGSGEELPDLPQTPRESRIIVISDTDLATDLLQYTGSQRNLDFLLQAADWLGNDDDIIGIRNRQGQTGRLDKISDTERRTVAMNFARILNVMLIPAAVIILGFVVVRRRRTFQKKSADKK